MIPNLDMGNGSFNWMMNQIFTWEMVLSIGWWTKSLHGKWFFQLDDETKSLHGKWFFQLDDEPNLYMGNGSFSWMMNQIFTWEMVLSIGWWTKSLHGKWFFQLDDEPNLYMGNGSFNWMMNQIFTWEMVLSIGWWTKSLHGKWFFQLDDEPNLDIKNCCFTISIHFNSLSWLARHMFSRTSPPCKIPPVAPNPPERPRGSPPPPFGPPGWEVKKNITKMWVWKNSHTKTPWKMCG